MDWRWLRAVVVGTCVGVLMGYLADGANVPWYVMLCTIILVYMIARR